MDRRTFIKGVLAAAVAAQIPLSQEQAESIYEAASHGTQDVGNGWYRHWYSFDSGKLPKKLMVRRGDSVLNVDTVSLDTDTGESYTFSYYAKDELGPNECPNGMPQNAAIWGATLESNGITV